MFGPSILPCNVAASLIVFLSLGCRPGLLSFSLKALLSGGSRHAAEFAARHGKPLPPLHEGTRDAAEKLRHFVRHHGIQTLHVAGPRASNAPDIGSFVTQVFNEAFSVQRSARAVAWPISGRWEFLLGDCANNRKCRVSWLCPAHRSPLC